MCMCNSDTVGHIDYGLFLTHCQCDIPINSWHFSALNAWLIAWLPLSCVCRLLQANLT